MQPEFLSIEGEDSDDWMLLDTGSVVVHCFTQEGRDEYDLEGLWTNIDKFIEEIEAETEEEELVRLEAEKMTVKPLK
jgi:ribosomal silencing factor RsfS